MVTNIYIINPELTRKQQEESKRKNEERKSKNLVTGEAANNAGRSNEE